MSVLDHGKAQARGAMAQMLNKARQNPFKASPETTANERVPVSPK